MPILADAYATAVSLVTTAETVVASIPALHSNLQEGVHVGGSVGVTTGTGTTAVVLQVRQGTTVAGTSIYSASSSDFTAGQTVVLPFDVKDISNVINSQAGTPYCVTVTQTGATANGTANQGYIKAEQQLWQLQLQPMIL